MTEILLSGKAVMAYEILMILVLVFVLIHQWKKNSAARERREIRNAKMRNVQLEEKLKNPDSIMDWSKTPNPFEVQYVQNPEKNSRPDSNFQIELEVHTETSVQRYLFDLDEEITVGKSERNSLPLNDKSAADRSCSIFRKNRSVYVKNENYEKPICIQRGKKKQLIQNQIVKLQSKDILSIGKTTLHISLYEN